jgi:hypothetical protein
MNHQIYEFLEKFCFFLAQAYFAGGLGRIKVEQVVVNLQDLVFAVRVVSEQAFYYILSQGEHFQLVGLHTGEVAGS